MRKFRRSLTLLFTTLVVVSCDNSTRVAKTESLSNMMIRIAEIRIDSNYLEEYRSVLKEEAEASVKLEPGVICIYPMSQKDNPTEIRILEIYSNKEAYNAHLTTRHFLKYKTTTQKMVRSLRLIDMEALDSTTMTLLFSKLKY